MLSLHHWGRMGCHWAVGSECTVHEAVGVSAQSLLLGPDGRGWAGFLVRTILRALGVSAQPLSQLPQQLGWQGQVCSAFGALGTSVQPPPMERDWQLLGHGLG